jgi:hypothetical protein
VTGWPPMAVTVQLMSRRFCQPVRSCTTKPFCGGSTVLGAKPLRSHRKASRFSIPVPPSGENAREFALPLGKRAEEHLRLALRSNSVQGHVASVP